VQTDFADRTTEQFRDMTVAQERAAQQQEQLMAVMAAARAQLGAQLTRALHQQDTLLAQQTLALQNQVHMHGQHVALAQAVANTTVNVLEIQREVATQRDATLAAFERLFTFVQDILACEQTILRQFFDLQVCSCVSLSQTDVCSAQSIAFYTAAVVCGYLLTSTNRTARFVLLLLLWWQPSF
jgi:hypothetical protein